MNMRWVKEEGIEEGMEKGIEKRTKRLQRI